MFSLKPPISKQEFPTGQVPPRLSLTTPFHFIRDWAKGFPLAEHRHRLSVRQAGIAAKLPGLVNQAGVQLLPPRPKCLPPSTARREKPPHVPPRIQPLRRPTTARTGRHPHGVSLRFHTHTAWAARSGAKISIKLTPSSAATLRAVTRDTARPRNAAPIVRDDKPQALATSPKSRP